MTFFYYTRRYNDAVMNYDGPPLTKRQIDGIPFWFLSCLLWDLGGMVGQFFSFSTPEDIDYMRGTEP